MVGRVERTNPAIIFSTIDEYLLDRYGQNYIGQVRSSS